MSNLQGVSTGWHTLVDGYPWFESPGAYLIPAYSEFMPPTRLGRTVYGDIDAALFAEDDPFGWRVSEREEEYELKPGLAAVARQVMGHLLNLGRGEPEYHIAGHGRQNLQDNPYWPVELAAAAGHLGHERYVLFLPLALSKTQDDKGRVIWTFFGASEQGPERAFWQSFYTAPGKESPSEEALSFLIRLLSGAYGEQIDEPAHLVSAGFRILPTSPGGGGEGLPTWTRSMLIEEQASFDHVHYLLTFRPFSRLPEQARKNYLAGRLNLLPFPGSLVFWGMPTYLRLQQNLPLAAQIPLLRLAARHNGPNGLRVPQSGWLHEPHPGQVDGSVQPELLAHHFTRTHRWDRIHRFEDELSLNSRVEKVLKVLFSTDLEVMGLYDKPMARNCQLWTEQFKLLLDGPSAGEKEIHRAEAALAGGGLFGYRFQYPAMRVGLYEVYWQRPLVAFLSPSSEQVELLSDPPLGYLTAYPSGSLNLAHPVELWPRLLSRLAYRSAVTDFDSPHDHFAHQTALNLLALLDAWQDLGQRPLARSFARRMLRSSKEEDMQEWLASLSGHVSRLDAARPMQDALEGILEPAGTVNPVPAGITFAHTATRDFELAYWNDIRFLAEGEFQNKDNADCVDDPATPSLSDHPHRELEQLGDYLLDRHRRSIERAGLQGQALAGDLPFHWRTDFDFPRFGGWKSNQEGHAQERDILVVIPGMDRTHPVVLADHYDTAYMEDLYEKARGGSGARKAAAGADDNYSATAVLLQAAPIYLQLAKENRLERDIWLLHLTGEEFPADCLGARHFCQALVERTLRLRLAADKWVDLLAMRPEGIFVMDMIAHNRDTDQDSFQISPGKSPRSLQLAYQAHLANLAWNAGTYAWNRAPERAGRGPGQRSSDGISVPATADHLRLNGEVRTRDDPESSLYNTDGQIFSDIGAPVVLFMENYDINRSGYHDTHDTMQNIDLDFGSALAAIAIETVARVATLPK